MDPDIDIFLPFSWISEHPLQSTSTNQKIRFNNLPCLEKCTQHETGWFTLT